MHNKPNCWEIKECGYGPDGDLVEESGLCPAAKDTSVDGVNGGVNGGRFCWAVAGTLCGGEVQGPCAQKIDSCMNCDVYRLVRIQEGDNCMLSKTAGTVADLLNTLPLKTIMKIVANDTPTGNR